MARKVHRYLAERVFGEPVMMAEPKLHAIMNVLGLGMDGMPGMPMMPSQEDDDEDEEQEIEVISVHGSLVKRTIGLEAESGLTSYVELADEILECAEAGKPIILDIDSPGGEAMGLFELTDVIAEARKKTKVWCVANPAYSAAYAIAAACERIYVPRDSEVGSIGVIACHLDVSEWDRKNGIKYTLVTAGEHKADFNPHKPLTDGALGRLQESVDAVYRDFVALVARGRNISEQAVVDTQAGLMRAEQAVPQFADRVGTLRDAIRDMRMELQASIDPAPASQSPALRIPTPIKSSETEVVQRRFNGLFESSDLVLCETPSIRSQIVVRDGRRVVTGIVAPYNKPSMILPQGFREIYEPGCFSESLSGDICAYAHHDSAKILGRTSSSTLRFFDRADGLHFEIDMPDTTYAKDLEVSMERADIGASSAGFFLRKDGYRFENRGGELYRIVSRGELCEASIVTKPAYPDATAEIAPPQSATALAAESPDTPIKAEFNDFELFEARLRLLNIP